MQLPESPVLNQIYTISSGKQKLIWNGFAWDRLKISQEGSQEDITVFKNTADIFKEIPIGEIDGYNFIFTLSETPIIESEHVFLNGVLQKGGEDYDYTIYGSSIYFIEPPYEGSTIICTYSILKFKEKINESANRVTDKIYQLTDEINKGNEMVYLNGLLLLEGLSGDYIIDSNLIKFTSPIYETDRVIVRYRIK
jgi:hypothetical protein